MRGQGVDASIYDGKKPKAFRSSKIAAKGSCTRGRRKHPHLQVVILCPHSDNAHQSRAVSQNPQPQLSSGHQSKSRRRCPGLETGETGVRFWTAAAGVSRAWTCLVAGRYCWCRSACCRRQERSMGACGCSWNCDAAGRSLSVGAAHSTLFATQVGRRLR